MKNSVKTSNNEDKKEKDSIFIEPTENPASELKMDESDIFKEDLIEQLKLLKSQNND